MIRTGVSCFAIFRATREWQAETTLTLSFLQMYSITGNIPCSESTNKTIASFSTEGRTFTSYSLVAELKLGAFFAEADLAVHKKTRLAKVEPPASSALALVFTWWLLSAISFA